MDVNTRIERAILVALIENLSAAGFKPAAVWTGEDYQRADGVEGDCGSIDKPMTTAEVLKVFDDFDMLTPTVHFTHQHRLTWGNRGVMVVNGNGLDFISDWHAGDLMFDAVVTMVADAASDGELTLFVAPVDIQDALDKAHDGPDRRPPYTDVG